MLHYLEIRLINGVQASDCNFRHRYNRTPSVTTSYEIAQKGVSDYIFIYQTHGTLSAKLSSQYTPVADLFSHKFHIGVPYTVRAFRVGSISNWRRFDCLRYHIAHIARMTLQAFIPHRPGQVRCTLQWPPACLHKLLPRGYQRDNWRTPRMKDAPNLINTGPTNPIHLWTYMDCLHILFASFKWYFYINKKNPR